MHAPVFPVQSFSHTSNRYFDNNNRVIAGAATSTLGWLMWVGVVVTVGSPPAATHGPLSKDGEHVWYVLALFHISM